MYTVSVIDLPAQVGFLHVSQVVRSHIVGLICFVVVDNEEKSEVEIIQPLYNQLWTTNPYDRIRKTYAASAFLLVPVI